MRMKERVIMKVCLAIMAVAPVVHSAQDEQQTPPPQSSKDQQTQQAQPPPAQTPQTSSQQPATLPTRSYVRRVSAGVTLSVQILKMFPNRTREVVTTTPAFDAIHATTDASRRVGFGFNAQVLLTNRFALQAGVYRWGVGYRMNSDIYEGTDNVNTIADERKHTVRNEDTRARFLDFPAVIRFYGKDRYEPGARWFLEAGAALRRVSKVRTSVDFRVNSGDRQCCDNTQPHIRGATGAVVGAGFQLIDPVGIRVIPEVRYTRWMGATINTFSTISQRNQIEAMISLSF